jgi:L,D-transpeptidase ErfK/SrfK
MSKLLFVFLFILVPLQSMALVFNLPPSGNQLVGTVRTAIVREDEDFSDIAQRFDVGYYEVFEANPGVDPDNPAVGTVLVIPTQYVLPTELQKNTVVVNLAEMRLYYQPKNENRVYIYPVGIGKEDWETPTGQMNVSEKIVNPKWVVPESIYKFRQSIGDPVPRVIMPGPDDPLGSFALRLSNKDYLIHGTNLPDGVGRRSSAGCIRLYEEDIKSLFKMVEIGTKVIVINKPFKAGWLGSKLYLEAHMPLMEQRIEMGDDMKPALDVVQAVLPGHSFIINWDKVKQIAKEHLTVPRVVN